LMFTKIKDNVSLIRGRGEGGLSEGGHTQDVGGVKGVRNKNTKVRSFEREGRILQEKKGCNEK